MQSGYKMKLDKISKWTNRTIKKSHFRNHTTT